MAAAAGAISGSLWLPSSPSKCSRSSTKPRTSFLVKNPRNPEFVLRTDLNLSTFLTHLSVQKDAGGPSRFSIKAASSSSVGSMNIEEPATKVKFQSSLSLPGCSTSLSLLATGYREKVFAIIGVKVYAAGLYVNQSVFSKLDAWKGRSADDLKQDSALFDTILKGTLICFSVWGLVPIGDLQKLGSILNMLIVILDSESTAPLEKSLQIVLVRDVDGKTFWDALDEAISPRIKQPTPDSNSALASFRSIFQGRPLNKGTFIFLTWLDSTKMLVSISSEGMPSAVDTTIESNNVTSALFDVFLGRDPVSPSLKNSVANGLAVNLK